MTRARTLADLGSASLATDAELASEVATLDSTISGLALGKVLQVVRTTDSTLRSTNSSSFVDVPGVEITITPQRSDSTILVIGSLYYETAYNGTTSAGRIQLTDSSNTALSGAEGVLVGIFGSSNSGTQYFEGQVTLIGYSTPATTSAVTYKARFHAYSPSSIYIRNQLNIGQMYAIEVSA